MGQMKVNFAKVFVFFFNLTLSEPGSLVWVALGCLARTGRFLSSLRSIWESRRLMKLLFLFVLSSLRSIRESGRRIGCFFPCVYSVEGDERLAGALSIHRGRSAQGAGAGSGVSCCLFPLGFCVCAFSIDISDFGFMVVCFFWDMLSLRFWGEEHRERHGSRHQIAYIPSSSRKHKAELVSLSGFARAAQRGEWPRFSLFRQRIETYYLTCSDLIL